MGKFKTTIFMFVVVAAVICFAGKSEAIMDFLSEELQLPESDLNFEETVQRDSDGLSEEEGIVEVQQKTGAEVQTEILDKAIIQIAQHQGISIIGGGTVSSYSQALYSVIQELLFILKDDNDVNQIWEVGQVELENGYVIKNLVPLNEEGEFDTNKNALHLKYNKNGKLINITPYVNISFFSLSTDSPFDLQLASIELLQEPVSFEVEKDGETEEVSATLKVSIKSSHAFEQEGDILSYTETDLYFSGNDIVYSEAHRERNESLRSIFRKMLPNVKKQLKDYLEDWDAKVGIWIEIRQVK